MIAELSRLRGLGDRADDAPFKMAPTQTTHTLHSATLAKRREREAVVGASATAAKAHNISNQQRQMITIITRRMTPIVMSTAGRTLLVLL